MWGHCRAASAPNVIGREEVLILKVHIVIHLLLFKVLCRFLGQIDRVEGRLKVLIKVL